MKDSCSANLTFRAHNWPKIASLREVPYCVKNLPLSQLDKSMKKKKKAFEKRHSSLRPIEYSALDLPQVSLMNFRVELVQSLNSPFFPPHIGAEPGRAKEESRITCMRMLRKPPFPPPPKSGEKPYLEVFSRFGLWRDFWMMKYKQQFLHSYRLKTCQLIPYQWNFTSATLNHIPFAFFITISKITKGIFAGIDNWKHRLGLESTRAALMQMSYLYASETYLTELKKALRDTLTRASWLGPSNFWCHFWLVRSEHAHASYPGLFFRPPGFSPYMGREERRVQGLD